MLRRFRIELWQTYVGKNDRIKHILRGVKVNGGLKDHGVVSCKHKAIPSTCTTQILSPVVISQKRFEIDDAAHLWQDYLGRPKSCRSNSQAHGAQSLQVHRLQPLIWNALCLDGSTKIYQAMVTNSASNSFAHTFTHNSLPMICVWHLLVLQRTGPQPDMCSLWPDNLPRSHCQVRKKQKKPGTLFSPADCMGPAQCRARAGCEQGSQVENNAV